MKGEFNGYSYKATLAYFRYTLKNLRGTMPSGEPVRDWFERCQGIELNAFKDLVKEREPDWFYRAVRDVDNPIDLDQPRKK